MTASMRSSPRASGYEENESLSLTRWIPNFCMDESLRKAICFRENLIVHSKHIPCNETTAIGGYCISVESIDDKQNEFLVNVSSSLTVKGQFGGSKLVSSATLDLNCLQEKRTEFLYTDSGYHEKELTVTLNKQNCAYEVAINKTCPCNKVNRHFEMPACLCNRLLSEGANIILSRYLAIKNFSGMFSLQNLNEEGRIVSCDYRCTSAECKVLHGRCSNVYTVERRMIDGCEVQIIVTYMSSNGRMLKHDWQSLPYILEVNPLLYSETRRGSSDWEEDVQMMSEYLDDKGSQVDYLAEHPEIKTLISDYVQTLLAVKPAEILIFTLKHILNAAKCENLIGKEDILEGDNLKQEMRRICNLCGICIDTKVPASKDRMKMSTCSLDSICQAVCDGCGDSSEQTCECESESSSESALSCSQLSTCNPKPECVKTCEGCQDVDRSKLEPCDEVADCQDTCAGCQVVDKSQLSPCESVQGCVDTCTACQKIDLEPCDVQDDCVETCEGCVKPENEPCAVKEDCKEVCEGCVKPKSGPLELCTVKEGCEGVCDGCL